jgi:hypothetical protein
MADLFDFNSHLKLLGFLAEGRLIRPFASTELNLALL